MTRSLKIRMTAMFICIALLCMLAGPYAVTGFAAETLNRRYTAVTRKMAAGNPVTYESEMVLREDGSFTYSVKISIPANPESPMFADGYDGTDTVSGTYTLSGSTLTFTDEGGTFDTGYAEEDRITVHGYISSFARMTGMSEFTLDKAENYADDLKAGKYELTAEDYDASAQMKMPMLFTIDTAAKTLNTQDPREGKELANKGFGSYTFDELTGVYTVTYSADTAEGATAQFTYAEDSITFISAAYFGRARMDIRDENDNFIPYTAHKAKEQAKFSDDLKAGKYELTAEDYDASAQMKMPMLFTIDTAAKTLNTQDPREGKELANKGFGSYTFDELTGVYTVTYSADTAEGATAQFTYAEDSITFISAAYFGRARMDIRDENNNFIPYTAHAVKDQTPVCEFKEGRYVGEYNKVAMSGVGIRYEISAVFAGGKYCYDVKVSLSNGEYNDSDPTKAGSYTVNGNSLVFDADSPLESAEITGEGKLKIYGTLSSFSFAPDHAELIWSENADPSEADEAAEAKIYKITDGIQREYSTGSKEDLLFTCEGDIDKFTDLKFDGVRTGKKYYSAVAGSTKVTVSGEFLETLSDGTHSISFVYTDGESENVKLRKAGPDGTYKDELPSGDYELKLEDFDERAGVHRHPCIITVDRDKETFIIHDTDDTETDKGSGTISFDSGTGEYTFTYNAGGPETQADPTSSFRYDNGLAFTSALKLGRSSMNITDEDGRFIPYTARPVSAAGQDDSGKSGTGSDIPGKDDDRSPATGYAAGAISVAALAFVFCIASRRRK